MFTGLVEEVGRLLRVVPRGDGAHLHVRAHTVLEGTRVGDSISVNGACLTVVHMEEGAFAADCMGETLRHTTLGELRANDAVNLERALALGDRLGGHLVLGHVDAVAEVRAVEDEGASQHLTIGLPPELEGLVAPKGSVAVDGVSLTVTEVGGGSFGIGVIPHTLEHTSLAGVGAGRRVNLEADVLARYVARALEAPGGREGRDGGRLTEEFLRGQGFA